jgi:hypothetical protein
MARNFRLSSRCLAFARATASSEESIPTTSPTREATIAEPYPVPHPRSSTRREPRILLIAYRWATLCRTRLTRAKPLPDSSGMTRSPVFCKGGRASCEPRSFLKNFRNQIHPPVEPEASDAHLTQTPHHHQRCPNERLAEAACSFPILQNTSKTSYPRCCDRSENWVVWSWHAMMSRRRKCLTTRTLSEKAR